MAFLPHTMTVDAKAGPGRRDGRRQPAAGQPDGEAGYTILEVLVVITIIGLLIGLVAPMALRQLGGARESIAQESITRIGTVLDLYNLDVGSYPTTQQGLQALVTEPKDVKNWRGPYLKGDGVPKDPWGEEFLYKRPSKRSGREYDLCSYGPNGTGTPENEQICN